MDSGGPSSDEIHRHSGDRRVSGTMGSSQPAKSMEEDQVDGKAGTAPSEMSDQVSKGKPKGKRRATGDFLVIKNAPKYSIPEEYLNQPKFKLSDVLALSLLDQGPTNQSLPSTSTLIQQQQESDSDSSSAKSVPKKKTKKLAAAAAAKSTDQWEGQSDHTASFSSITTAKGSRGPVKGRKTSCSGVGTSSSSSSSSSSESTDTSDDEFTEETATSTSSSTAQSSLKKRKRGTNVGNSNFSKSSENKKSKTKTTNAARVKMEEEEEESGDHSSSAQGVHLRAPPAAPPPPIVLVPTGPPTQFYTPPSKNFPDGRPIREHLLRKTEEKEVVGHKTVIDIEGPIHSGKKCHLCKSTGVLIICGNFMRYNSDYNKACRLVYCRSCLEAKCGKTWDALLEEPDWLCPHCIGVCPAPKCPKVPRPFAPSNTLIGLIQPSAMTGFPGDRSAKRESSAKIQGQLCSEEDRKRQHQQSNKAPPTSASATKPALTKKETKSEKKDPKSKIEHEKISTTKRSKRSQLDFLSQSVVRADPQIIEKEKEENVGSGEFLVVGQSKKPPLVAMTTVALEKRLQVIPGDAELNQTRMHNATRFLSTILTALPKAVSTTRERLKAKYLEGGLVAMKKEEEEEEGGVGLESTELCDGVGSGGSEAMNVSVSEGLPPKRPPPGSTLSFSKPIHPSNPLFSRDMYSHVPTFRSKPAPPQTPPLGPTASIPTLTPSDIVTFFGVELTEPSSEWPFPGHLFPEPPPPPPPPPPRPVSPLPPPAPQSRKRLSVTNQPPAGAAAAVQISQPPPPQPQPFSGMSRTGNFFIGARTTFHRGSSRANAGLMSVGREVETHEESVGAPLEHTSPAPLPPLLSSSPILPPLSAVGHKTVPITTKKTAAASSSRQTKKKTSKARKMAVVNSDQSWSEGDDELEETWRPSQSESEGENVVVRRPAEEDQANSSDSEFERIIAPVIPQPPPPPPTVTIQPTTRVARPQQQHAGKRGRPPSKKSVRSRRKSAGSDDEDFESPDETYEEEGDLDYRPTPHHGGESGSGGGGGGGSGHYGGHSSNSKHGRATRHWRGVGIRVATTRSHAVHREIDDHEQEEEVEEEEGELYLPSSNGPSMSQSHHHHHSARLPPSKRTRQQTRTRTTTRKSEVASSGVGGVSSSEWTELTIPPVQSYDYNHQQHQENGGGEWEGHGYGVQEEGGGEVEWGGDANMYYYNDGQDYTAGSAEIEWSGEQYHQNHKQEMQQAEESVAAAAWGGGGIEFEHQTAPEHDHTWEQYQESLSTAFDPNHYEVESTSFHSLPSFNHADGFEPFDDTMGLHQPPQHPPSTHYQGLFGQSDEFEYEQSF